MWGEAGGVAPKTNMPPDFGVPPATVVCAWPPPKIPAAANEEGPPDEEVAPPNVTVSALVEPNRDSGSGFFDVVDEGNC